VSFHESIIFMINFGNKMSPTSTLVNTTKEVFCNRGCRFSGLGGIKKPRLAKRRGFFTVVG
jgi:hypothetical protein